MAIVLISEEPLEGNAALFENDSTIGEDLGDIDWTELEEVLPGKWEFNFQGTDVEGNSIASTPLSIEAVELPSPSEVFWFIAQKAKSTLCPTCSNGY